MHLERTSASESLRRLRADSDPRGVLSTGLLQGFIRTAGPPSFCSLLPRVHAADVDAAQLAQMPSPSPSSYTSPALSTLPGNMGKQDFCDTGWDRIKDLFQKDVTQNYPEELMAVVNSGVVAAVAGWLYGGVPAAREAHKRYIEVSQAEIYRSRMEAVRSSHNAAIRGFIRYGWRWSWRVAAFATLFNSLSIGLSVFRDKYTVSNYVVAGGVTGGLFRLNLGLRGLLAGTVIGAVLGCPTGALIVGLQSLAGESVRERRKRERREFYELKLQEWTARLQLTDNVIRDLNTFSQADESSKDLQRIQELLSLPRNEGAAQDTSSQ